MLRRLSLGAWLLTILVGAGACAGKTVVLDPPAPAAPTATHIDRPADPQTPTGPDGPAPSPTEGGDRPSGSEAVDDGGDDTGWWPPAPSPSETAEPDPTPSDEGTSEPEPSETPTDDDRGEEERFTFPGWEEYIYDSRNGERPEKFENRERFNSCGDYASEAGAHVISPEAADCLDEGRKGPGKESAIAVRMDDGGVHVWFVRVGPDTAEYYVDRTPAGGGWLHATCDADASIGVLACEEPKPVSDEPAGENEPRPPEEESVEQPDDAPEDKPEDGPEDEDEPEEADDM